MGPFRRLGNSSCYFVVLWLSLPDRKRGRRINLHLWSSRLSVCTSTQHHCWATLGDGRLRNRPGCDFIILWYCCMIHYHGRQLLKRPSKGQRVAVRVTNDASSSPIGERSALMYNQLFKYHDSKTQRPQGLIGQLLYRICMAQVSVLSLMPSTSLLILVLRIGQNRLIIYIILKTCQQMPMDTCG